MCIPLVKIVQPKSFGAENLIQIASRIENLLSPHL